MVCFSVCYSGLCWIDVNATKFMNFFLLISSLVKFFFILRSWLFKFSCCLLKFVFFPFFLSSSYFLFFNLPEIDLT